MNRSRTLRSLGIATLFFVASLGMAAQTAVKHSIGVLHGFLVIRSLAGSDLGYGEFIESAVGDRVTVHMTYHFRDGSLDDEVTVFTQDKTFQFVSDHHIQRGRFFPKPYDMTVEANGQVTIRTTDKDGKPKVETEHMDLSPDFSSGMVGTIVQNLPADASEFKLGMIVPTGGKGRAIKLDVASTGQQSFHIAGITRKATIYRIKPELGGVVGIIAPLVGKQPGDIYLSVLQGEAPVVVRIFGPLGEDTATVSIELAGTSFPKSSTPAPSKNKK